MISTATLSNTSTNSSPTTSFWKNRKPRGPATRGLAHNINQYGGGLIDVHPPSITRFCPVICLAPSETRKSAASAISPVLAGRHIGVMADQVLSYAASSIVLSVSVAPGAIVFTLIR